MQTFIHKRNHRCITRCFCVSLVVLLAVIFSLSLSAALPQNLQIHGTLADSSSIALNGTYNITFRIYNASSSGSTLFTQNRTVTLDSNGIFNTILTDVNLSFADAYYLGVSVGSDNEMAPRVNLTSSPYAFRSNVSEALDTTRNYQVQNLTLAQQIVFSFGQTIDNILNTIIRVNGNFIVSNESGTGFFFVNTSNFRVGIGTTQPTQTLDVRGNVNVSSEVYVNNGSAVSVWLYNQTYTSGTYNATYVVYAYNQSLVNGTFNQSYHNYAYNQTGIGGVFNSSYLTTSNASTTFVPYAGANANTDVGIFNLTASWFKGLFNFIIGKNVTSTNSTDYLTFNGSTLEITTNVTKWLYNETSLANSYADSQATGLNSTTNVQNLLNATGVYVTYNATYQGLANNASYLSTYNESYANYSYNQTYTGGIFNQSYADYAYNQTYTAGTYNATYHGLANNASYLSTYNESYEAKNSSQWIVNGSNISNRNSGSVGINVTNPNRLLTVNGIANITGELYVQAGSAVSGWLYNQSSPYTFGSYNETYTAGTYNASYATINTSANVAALINGSLFNSVWNISGTNVFPKSLGWNVGIGTATPNYALEINNNSAGLNVSNNLFVNGSGVGIGTSVQGDLLEINKTVASGNALIRIDAPGPNGWAGIRLAEASQNRWALYHRTTDDYLYITDVLNSVDKFIMQPNTTGSISLNSAGGNVGIGTTAPNYLLEVGAGTGGKSVNLSNTLFVNGTSGNVGIGTTAPASKLDVNGILSVRNDLDLYGIGGTRYWSIQSEFGGSQKLGLYDRVAAAYRLAVDTSGNVGIGADTTPDFQLEVGNDVTGTAGKPAGGTWSDSSDARLKKNVIPLNNSLKELLKLRPVNYEWINPQEHIGGADAVGMVHAGLIAQDVEQVFPQWINYYNASGNDSTLIPSGDQARSLFYPSDFNAYLIGAIQDLAKVINYTDAPTNASVITIDSSGKIRISGSISAGRYITRTEVWNETQGDALMHVKDSKELLSADGTIDHAAFDDAYVRYALQNGTDEEGVDVVKVVAKHEQALYELAQKLKTIELNGTGVPSFASIGNATSFDFSSITSRFLEIGGTFTENAGNTTIVRKTTTLYANATSGNVGIGTATPRAKLEVSENGTGITFNPAESTIATTSGNLTLNSGGGSVVIVFG